MIPVVEKGRVWFVAGNPGAGKSTVLNHWIDHILATDPEAVALIHDPHGRSDAAPGFEGKHWDTVDDLSRPWPFRGSLARRNVFRRALPVKLARAAAALGKRRHVVLAFDEVDLFVSGQVIRPDNHEVDCPCDPCTKYDTLNYARHRNVTVVGSARRLQRVGTDLPALAEGKFLLNIQGPTDLEVVRAVAGPIVRDLVSDLPPWEGFYVGAYSRGVQPFRVSRDTLELFPSVTLSEDE